MYSRYRRGEGDVTDLPARYSGVRFRRDRRSDGRDVVVETPMREPERDEPVAPRETERGGEAPSLSRLLSGVGGDDLLIAAIMILIAEEGGEGSREASLLLLLLLCIR